METEEIIQAIANIHNDLCKMFVCADNAVIVGRSIENMRALLAALNQDVAAKGNNISQEGADVS